MEPIGDDLHWRLVATPELSTPGKFLFGGCGLGAGLVALEAAAGRPTVWATPSTSLTHRTNSVVDYEVTLAVIGGHVTQARATARVDGNEILTVNSALGSGQTGIGGRLGEPAPIVPAPKIVLGADCPRCLPTASSTPSTCG